MSVQNQPLATSSDSTQVSQSLSEPVLESIKPDVLIDITEKLERIYNVIYTERMHDIPIVNTDINVHAIGFQAWKNNYLGVMITPWFMNLTLLPGESEDWSDKPELSTVSHVFPSGKYSFTIGFEAELGHYQSCSLFSPMFEFADDQAAVDTAEAVMHELMNQDNVTENDIDTEKIAKVWNGEATEDEVKDILAERDGIDISEIELPKPDKPTLSEKVNKPMSRRNLISGSFLKDEQT